MKKTVTFLAATGISLFAILACNKKSDPGTGSNAVMPQQPEMKFYGFGGSLGGSQPITIDTANVMISSYLQSIQGNTDTDVQSFSMSADSLRQYLNDTSRGKIANLKIVFAHTMNYINSGGRGKYAGYRSGALTLIVVGYDINGNYIYNGQNEVYDHMVPCPTSCPNGPAGNGLLQ